jgi:NADH dehydrogenase [ubiquinone] 1 alpha subcomplex assembly factor 7
MSISPRWPGAARDAGARAHGPVAQGVLLDRLGIAARAGAAGPGLDRRGRAAHIAAIGRLTHREEMGTVFKALAITPPRPRPRRISALTP